MFRECFDTTNNHNFACKTKDGNTFEWYCGYGDNDKMTNGVDDDRTLMQKNNTTWYIKHLEDNNGTISKYITGDYNNTIKLADLLENHCKPQNNSLLCRKRKGNNFPTKCYCLDDEFKMQSGSPSLYFTNLTDVWSDSVIKPSESIVRGGGDT